MNDAGRMARRLADSYREDDRRDADRQRRSLATPGTRRGRAAKPAPRPGFAMIVRLIPWLA